MEKVWLAPFSALPTLTCRMTWGKSLPRFSLAGCKTASFGLIKADQSLWGFPTLMVKNVGFQVQKRGSRELKERRGAGGPDGKGSKDKKSPSLDFGHYLQIAILSHFHTPVEMNRDMWPYYPNILPARPMTLYF